QTHSSYHPFCLSHGNETGRDPRNDVGGYKSTLEISAHSRKQERRLPNNPAQQVRFVGLNDLPRRGQRVFPISANSLKLAWKRVLRRANIKDLHFHDLRHEAIGRFCAGISQSTL